MRSPCLFVALALVLLSSAAGGQECLEVIGVEVVCLPGGSGDVTVSLTLVNSSVPSFGIDRVFLWVDPLANYTASPDTFLFAPAVPPGGELSLTFTLSGAEPGADVCFDLSAHDSGTGECCAELVCVSVPDCDGEPEFIRGDINDDGGVNIGDAIYLLNELFSGGPPSPCQDSGDTNDDGLANIADAIYLLGYLFTSGPEPPPPFPGCGPDPTNDPLMCAEFSGCP